MNDELTRKIRSRVEYRLAKAPRYATINALLFSLAAAALGVLAFMMPPDWSSLYYGSMVFILMLFGVIAWAGLTALYAIGLFAQSGAWSRRREQLIQSEILEVIERYNLEEDDSVDLHLKVSQEVEQNAQPFRRLLVHGLLNGIGWVGGFGLLALFWLFIGFFPFVSTGSLLVAMSAVSLLSIPMLPLHVIFQKQEPSVEHLRAVYGGKPKRTMAESEPDYSRLIQTGDDGELIYDDLDDEIDTPDEKPKVDHRGA